MSAVKVARNDSGDICIPIVFTCIYNNATMNAMINWSIDDEQESSGEL